MKNEQKHAFYNAFLRTGIFVALLFVVPVTVEASVPHVQVVAQDFRAVFGRPPTHNELAYWAMRRYDRVAPGHTRENIRDAMRFVHEQGQVVGGLPPLRPVEIVQRTSHLFEAVYNRPPTAGERQWWVDRIECGHLLSYEDVSHSMQYHAGRGVAVGVGTRSQFCDSAKQRSWNVPIANTRFSKIGVPHVELIAHDFRAVFGRSPTHNELAYWAMRRYDRVTREHLRESMRAVHVRGNVVGNMPSLDAGSINSAVGPLFVAVYGRSPSAREHQWWVDRVECADLMSYRDVFYSMRYHAGLGIGIGTGTREQFCARAEHRRRVVPVNRTLNLTGHPNGPVVRIGIWETDQDIQVTSLSTKFFLNLPDGKKKYFNAGDVVTVRNRGSDYRVTGPGGYRVDLKESEVEFSPDPHTGIMVAHNYTNPNPALIPCPSGSNQFRGNLIARRNSNGSRMWLINRLRAEEYMLGVTETSNISPAEFQKALTLTARTYVLHWHLRGGRQPHNGFLITNTGNDQVYCGYRFERNAPRWVEHVNATKGEIITFDNGLIAAVYFSQSDGRTRSAREVWNTIRFPYLQGKKDPHGGSTLRGHGVGMSALGALNFARLEGWDYHQILHYYYTDVRIERGY